MNSDQQHSESESPIVTTKDLYPEGHPVNDYQSSQSMLGFDAEEEIRAAQKTRAKKDILYGALWCGGGLIMTIADTGFIFWGAIVFGGIQLFKGIANYKD